MESRLGRPKAARAQRGCAPGMARIHPALVHRSPSRSNAPSRGRLRFCGAGRVDERACGFDKRAGQPVWTAEGRPRAARVRAMDGAHPSRPRAPLPLTKQRPSRGRLRFCGAGRVDERACGFDQSAWEADWDGRRPPARSAGARAGTTRTGARQSLSDATRNRSPCAPTGAYSEHGAAPPPLPDQSASMSPSARINRRARLSGFDSGGWKPARSAARSARACSRARREASDSL